MRTPLVRFFGNIHENAFFFDSKQQFIVSNANKCLESSNTNELWYHSQLIISNNSLTVWH